MALKILHLEDSATKHSTISRAIKKMVSAEIDWVNDMATGIEKIDDAMNNGVPYDLAITDMHYPLSPGVKADWETGDFFVDVVKQRYDNLPVIVCSTQNMKNPKAYGCVWFSEICDWEGELRELIKKINAKKNKGTPTSNL